MKSKEETVELTDVCDKFCKWVNRVIGAVVTAGIGMVCDSLYQILIIRMKGQGKPYHTEYLYGTKRAINIDEITPNKQNMAITVRRNKDA